MLNDTTKEIEELQNELWMKRTTQERAEFMFGMFATARRMIINSLPKDLPARIKKTNLRAHLRRAAAGGFFPG